MGVSIRLAVVVHAFSAARIFRDTKSLDPHLHAPPEITCICFVHADTLGNVYLSLLVVALRVLFGERGLKVSCSAIRQSELGVGVARPPPLGWALQVF